MRTLTEFQPAQTLDGFAGEACTLRERTTQMNFEDKKEGVS